jgi:hypothetical protein
MLNLAEYWADYNQDGFGAVHLFGAYTYRCGGIWGGLASAGCVCAGLEGVTE